jgi:hypothetical protein
MPTDPVPSVEIARLIAARDEALRRYTQHLAAIQLKNSRWCAVLSRGGSAARGRLAPVPTTMVKPATHAH